jgi:hypothetical protein
MRQLLLALTVPVALLGCAPQQILPQPIKPQPVMLYDNPILAPCADSQYVFETVEDVIGDYFRIDHEEPVRQLGTSLTEGRIETYPKVGATIFEPWDNDSVGTYDRLECTVQSIRRRALVRVMPTSGGYWIEVTVLKELENLKQPEQSPASASTFRTDGSLTRVVNPESTKDLNRGWIDQGRDAGLEQRILGQLLYRFNLPGGGR